MSSMNNVHSTRLIHSDFYEVKHWTFDFGHDLRDRKGFNDCLCMVFVTKGRFLFDLAKKTYDLHTGHVLIDKPNYEYRVRPSSGQCTVFNFTDEFYRQALDDPALRRLSFFSRKRMLSAMRTSTPEMEHLHYQIQKQTGHSEKLDVDTLVADLFNSVTTLLHDGYSKTDVSRSLKCHHLGTVEKAKEYLNHHFASDISLFDLSQYCCVSPFHFSRIFKTFTSYSPNQYLLNIRIKHGELLLKNSGLPISKISMSCGFNSPEYFTATFRNKFGLSPTEFRKTHRRTTHRRDCFIPTF